MRKTAIVNRVALLTALAAVWGCGGSLKANGEADATGDTGAPDGMDVTIDGTDIVEEDGPVGCTDDSECDDGDPCNGEETCGSGGVCEDGIALADDTDCIENGVEGTCVAGECVPLTCGDGALDEGEECDDANIDETDGCETTCEFSCHEDAECNDDNVCTDDSCSEGGNGQVCDFVDNDAPCEDGDECTGPDVCSEGSCTPGPGLCGCDTDADCEVYEDEDLCNGTLVCDTSTGNCNLDPATVVECTPSEVLCSENVCDPATGDCGPVPADVDTPCESDGNACTTDMCDGDGVCEHAALSCADTNPCTNDSCDPASGCVHETIPDCCTTDIECSDLDECTMDTCTDSSCTHAPVDCGDSSLCTIDTCDPSTGCVYTPESCDDHNDCTGDFCDAVHGCLHSYLTGSCEDGDPCTGPDSCNDTGTCVPGPDLPVWYADADGDGFGDPGVTACAAAEPAGYAGNAEDCCDSEADANPDQTTYFADPFTCVGSTTPSWDYNCGGADYLRWPDYGGCNWWITSCNYDPGWSRAGYPDPPIPDCGETGSFITGCNASCGPVYAPRRQECI